MYEKMIAELKRQESQGGLYAGYPDTLHFNGVIDLRLLYATVRDEVVKQAASNLAKLMRDAG